MGVTGYLAIYLSQKFTHRLSRQEKTVIISDIFFRGKYIMPHPTAQDRRGYCSSMSPGPTSSEAEDVFPAGACTQSTLIRHIYTWLAPQITDRHSEHPHKHRQHRQCHPAPLSGSPGWRSTSQNIHIRICKRWIPAAIGLAQSAQ